MNIFPINKRISRKYYSRETIKKTVRTEYSEGTTISKSAYTKARKRWSIGWTNLDDDELEVLESFFSNNRGLFLFSDFDGMEYVVRFSSDTFGPVKSNGFKDGKNLWDTGEIQIEEK